MLQLLGDGILGRFYIGHAQTIGLLIDKIKGDEKLTPQEKVLFLGQLADLLSTSVSALDVIVEELRHDIIDREAEAVARSRQRKG